MNTVRTSVEWSYMELKQMFASHDYHRKLKVRAAPVAVTYVLSAVLMNFKTCLYGGGQGPNYFGCAPPTLREYTRLEPEAPEQSC